MALPPVRRVRLCTIVGLLVVVSATIDGQPPRASDSLAALVGRVIDSAKVGLSGAEVVLVERPSLRAVTDDSGFFRLGGLPTGVQEFSVRRLGFAPLRFAANLRPAQTQHATIPLSATPAALPEIDVSDSSATHWLDAFNARRAHHHGVFFTREEIAKTGARNGIDVARRVPGMRVRRTYTGNVLVLERGGMGPRRECQPTYFVQGNPYSGTLEDFNADDLEAIEFYVGVSEIPPDLLRGGRDVCAAIVIWTRDPRGRPR